MKPMSSWQSLISLRTKTPSAKYTEETYELCKALVQLMAATLLIMTYDSSVKMLLVAKTSSGKGKPDYVCEYKLNLLLFLCAGGIYFETREFVLSMRWGLNISCKGTDSED